MGSSGKGGAGKQKKRKSMSGPNMYAQAQGSGVTQAHQLISDVAAAKTRLSGRSAAGSRLGKGEDAARVKGRSDVAQAAAVDKKKKKASLLADAAVIGSSGKTLGA